MLRTAAILVVLVAVGFLIGCGRDKPQPVAQSTEGTKERETLTDEKKDPAQTNLGDASLAEGLDLSNKVADSRESQAAKPDSPKKEAGTALESFSRSEAPKSATLGQKSLVAPGGGSGAGLAGLGGGLNGGIGGGIGGLGGQPGTPPAFGAMPPQNRAFAAGGVPASGPAPGFGGSGRGGEATMRMKL